MFDIQNYVGFEALQWFGAAYLGWLGIQLLRSPIASDVSATEQKKSGWRYFQQAFMVSLTNPKVILFFMAFFPLFLRADASSVTLGVLMAHVTHQLLVPGRYRARWQYAARKLSSLPSVRKVAARLAGMALIGFGAYCWVSQVSQGTRPCNVGILVNGRYLCNL